MAIFINYRRDDDPGFAIALYGRLENEFGADQVFMDVEGHIRPGEPFEDVINARVAQCRVMLTVIGPRWVPLMATRAGDTRDFVTIEIQAAIDQGTWVIPVTVGRANMPIPAVLPEAIRALAGLQAVELRREHFGADCHRLIAALREILPENGQEFADDDTSPSVGEAIADGIPPVNPKNPYGKVFIFNVAKFLHVYGNLYDATRQAWLYNRQMNTGGVAVGLVRGISQGVYVFKNWEEAPGTTNRYMFRTEEVNRYDLQNNREHELLKRDWRKIIGMSGFYNFGGNLVFEFDGRGKFRFLRGRNDGRQWHSL